MDKEGKPTSEFRKSNGTIEIYDTAKHKLFRFLKWPYRKQLHIKRNVHIAGRPINSYTPLV